MNEINTILDNVLFKSCLNKDWQMTMSERIGLKGILASVKPEVSIEIGTYKGGSLSLLQQYSKEVISLDIDKNISELLTGYKNVIFITGDSKQILPELFKELSEKKKNIQLILLDGEHSSSGVEKDINCIIEYFVPINFCLLIMHDTFNPDCRKGILNAKWSKSKYLSYYDIDFIPGRIIEEPGLSAGELWGGLGLAIFEKRKTNIVIKKESAKLMFNIVKSYSNDIFCKEKDNGTLKDIIKKFIPKNMRSAFYKIIRRHR